jgi:ribonuclease HII
LAILAGIDEAGFGPLLGPLVVSGVAFRVPDRQLGDCLWDTLRATCAPSPQRGGRRLVVADSKRLYRSRGGLAPLEQTALVMLAAAGARPATWRALLDTVAPGAAERLDRYPWYAAADTTLPLSDSVGDVGTRSNAVRRDLADHNVSFLGVDCEPLHEGEYNQLIRSTRNKSVVLLGLALRTVDRIIRRAPGERVRLSVDRLGGRTHYRDALMTAVQGYELRVVEESPTRSAYALTRSTRVCEIEFVTGGDRKRFPVALASIYSKYVRELHMHAFNRYWSGRIAGLRPTAGYYTDARRWLREAGPDLGRHAISRNQLVRDR